MDTPVTWICSVDSIFPPALALEQSSSLLGYFQHVKLTIKPQ